MYRLYEKVPKSAENTYGIKMIEDQVNPFLNFPCLLCVIPNAIHIKNLNGAMNRAMNLLQISNGDAKYDLDISEAPCRLMSLAFGDLRENGRFEKQNEKKENTIEFVEKYLYPLIQKDNSRIDPIQAMRNMRNINFMSYCNGVNVIEDIEEILRNRMVELGYANEQINNILAQMCVCAISTDKLYGKEAATYISVRDINDKELANYSEGAKAQVRQDGGVGIYQINANEAMYLVDGNGQHSLDKYVQDDTSLSIGISSVLNKAIRNSLLNSQNQSEFKPITTDELLEDVKEVFKDAKQGETKSELLTKIKTKNLREMINEKEIGILKKISPENIKRYSSEIKIGKQEIDGVTQETRGIITQENTKANELTSK